jgi:hydroxyacylglutathione hydrolase
MLVERFFTPELAQVAYAVGDAETREVAIIDPRRDIDAYVTWARERDLRIVAVLETHVHADFVSGAPALAAATGAPLYTSRLGQQDFDHIPVDDGFTLEIGTVRITAVHTPGHTPEHIAWQAVDTTTPEAAPVFFSGDSLFVGDVGRPDLLGKDQTDALVSQLYETVTTVFERLPAGTVVYPGHTAGSSCGKKIGDDPQTTIGREMRENYAFQTGSASEFRTTVMADMPTPPTYYPTLKRVNKAGAEPVEALPDGREMDADAVAAAQAAGSLVVDARDKATFSKGYIPGSVFAAGNDMATWLGWIAPYDRDLVFVVDDRAMFEDARRMMRRIGLDRVAGYIVGVEGWAASGRALATLGEVSAATIHDRIATPGAPLVFDVRSDSEWEEGHIPEATHHFLGRITQGEMPELDTDAEIVIVCASGYRSTVAGSLMQDAGFRNLASLVGGMDAWNETEQEARREAPAGR